MKTSTKCDIYLLLSTLHTCHAEHVKLYLETQTCEWEIFYAKYKRGINHYIFVSHLKYFLTIVDMSHLAAQHVLPPVYKALLID
jgi:hypothetical protein